MRRFYICFPISTTVLSELSWSHYLELIKIEEEPKRNFYMKEIISSDKAKVLELSKEGQVLRQEKT